MSSVRRSGPILVLAGIFLALSAATLDDFGLTWDEGVKMNEFASYAVTPRSSPVPKIASTTRSQSAS